jgi:hypothetical protein
MLQLLIPVPLDALEQGSQGHLLLGPQALLLLDQGLLCLLFNLRSLHDFSHIAIFLKLLSFFNLLSGDKNMNLFLHIHEFLRKLNFTFEFTLNTLLKLLNFKQMLLLELL